MTSSATAGYVFLALSMAHAGFLFAAIGGLIEAEFGAIDLATAPISIGLGVAAGTGLLRQRRWGWWAGVAFVFLALLELLVDLLVHLELDPALAAAFGLVWLVVTAVMALLDAPSVRNSLSPPPPSSGLFARLPIEGCLTLGVVVVALGFSLLGVFGWTILLVWILMRLLWRTWRRRSAHAA